MKRISLNTTDKGQKAEQHAEQFLLSQGLTFRQRNFRKACGEIDLIMQEGSTIIFVEVKLRKPGALVSGLESVDRRKQRRLIKTAAWYLQAMKSPKELPCRFDVVAISYDSRENAHSDDWGSSIEWIKSAFYAG